MRDRRPRGVLPAPSAPVRPLCLVGPATRLSSERAGVSRSRARASHSVDRGSDSCRSPSARSSSWSASSARSSACAASAVASGREGRSTLTSTPTAAPTAVRPRYPRTYPPGSPPPMSSTNSAETRHPRGHRPEPSPPREQAAERHHRGDPGERRHGGHRHRDGERRTQPDRDRRLHRSTDRVHRRRRHGDDRAERRVVGVVRRHPAPRDDGEVGEHGGDRRLRRDGGRGVQREIGERAGQGHGCASTHRRRGPAPTGEATRVRNRGVVAESRVSATTRGPVWHRGGEPSRESRQRVARGFDRAATR